MNWSSERAGGPMIDTPTTTISLMRQRVRLRPSAPTLTPELLAVIGLIVVSTFATMAYIWALCPLELAPDEAHYWDWSRHLDWSYYSKGPLVAWLIRGSCE